MRRRRATAGRLIPAHAGKTSATMPSAQRRRAHPRSRGENRAATIHSVNIYGSSPLTRGKLTPTNDRQVRLWLIPAHAGKTWTVPGPGRVRAGSSPLTRGKRSHHRPALRDQRLIPAHAGKTTTPRLNSSPATAHPRSRGENRRVHRVGVGDRGSSPLTRGKPIQDAASGAVIRLIPAHAGKTRS